MRKMILGIALASAVALPVHAMQVSPLNVRVWPHVEQALMKMDLKLAKLNMQHLGPLLDRSVLALEMNMPMIEQSLMMGMSHLERSIAELEMRLPLLMISSDDLELPPESWAPQDPADSVYTAARAALQRRNASQAADLFRRIRSDARFARSTYRDVSYYWEAYARHQIGTIPQLRQAQGLLQELRREFPRFENMDDVTSLQGQINAALAANGDAQAQRQVERTVQNVARQQCPDVSDQEAALHALMSMPGQASLPMLRNVMARRDACSADLRENAIMLVARMKTPEAEAILVEAAKSDPNEDVRHAAVMWLASQGSERSIEVLEEIVRTSTDEDMIQLAIHSLSRQNSARSTQLLRDLATRTNVDPDVRAFAIYSLGQRGDAESMALIRSLWPSLTDEDSKQMALMALGRSRTPGSEEFLLSVVNNEREPEDVRSVAFHMLTQQQNISPARLGEMYDRATSEDMKMQIIMALSRSTETTALDQMIRIGRAERDADVRQMIIHMVGRSNDPRAVRFLTEIIGGGN